VKHALGLRTFLGAAFIVLAAVAVAQSAEPRLHNYFTDHMVLQRGEAVVVAGFAEKGAAVEVSFAGQTKTGKAGDDGAWTVTLDPMPAAAVGRDLQCKIGGKTIVVRDVVVGDVYLFGRQTYIDVSLGKDAAGKAAAAALKPSGKFRAISIKTIPAKQPEAELNADSTSGWAQVDQKFALQMSAAAFYLGRDVAAKQDVPIGIVDVDMAQYFAIGWLSDQTLKNLTQIYPDDGEIDWLPDWMREEAEKRDSGEAQLELDAYHLDRVEKQGEKRAGEKPSLGLHPIEWPIFPSAGYNAVIHPLRQVKFKAILLQLGNDYPYVPYMRLVKIGKVTDRPELDRAWEYNYKIMKHGYRVTPVTLPYVPADWRRAFGDKDLPIGLILPPGSDLDAYAQHNREIREMHRRTAEQNDRIGLILPGMDNVPFSGQPADEQLLAERCKHWLLSAVAGETHVTATGPVFDRAEAFLGDATVYFKAGTADGLTASGDALSLFEVSGPDGQFTPATAKIDGSTIKLHSDVAGQIEFIRYNWQNKPNPGLVNGAGLPALPFNTDADWQFAWYVNQAADELPDEYRLTADKWDANDLAIINGEVANLAGGDSQKIPHRPGPLGFTGGPFGPNIFVIKTEPGTPAHGKLQYGDLIFSTNGQSFSGDADAVYRQLSEAITYSETEAGGGKLVLGVRRGSKVMDVTLELEVMGAYSATTPYYCPKTAQIIQKAQQWSLDRYRPASGLASSPDGFLHTDLLFLLATGDPQVQGLVRRSVYEIMAEMEPLQPADPMRRVSNWGTGYRAMLLGEYYHATGDRNVLPYLKNLCDQAAASQLKPATGPDPVGYETAQFEEVSGGWRHKAPTDPDRWKSGYGLLPHAGMACVTGMIFADEAGLDIDKQAMRRGIEHFRKQRAEHAYVLYSYRNVRVDGPAPIRPEAEANGMLWSMNGKLGNAAAMFDLLDDQRVVEICSRYCVYGYNNTRSGHGGMFFNNFWTPVGAYAAGEAGFKHFMKGQTWWRELYRRHDGSFDQAGRGGIGVAYGLHYVAPRERLRMLGAPVSAFGTAAPAYLKPALAAHQKRDYALAERLITRHLENEVTPAEDVAMVEHLLQSIRILRKSIEHDLAYTERMISEGKHYYASLELPQLKAVVAADNPRLKAIVDALESPEGQRLVSSSKARANRETSEAEAALAKLSPKAQRKQNWVCLTPPSHGKNAKPGDTPTQWRMKLIEDRVQAPTGWMAVDYNDDAWYQTTLPISWAMYHSVLYRGQFNVADKDAIESLRIRGQFFQQSNLVVYINGKLVGKIDNIGRGAGTVVAPLTGYAIDVLKNGENTIAFSTKHQRRWGALRGRYTQAAEFGFMIDADMKQ
jgi:sialate O-acetylesterase